MRNAPKIKYVVGELSKIIGRMLSSKEWSRVGKICNQYSIPELNNALDQLEDKLESGELRNDEPIGLLQYLLSFTKASKEGKDIVEDILSSEHTL